MERGDEVIVSAVGLQGADPLSPNTGIITQVHPGHKHVVTLNSAYMCHSMIYPNDIDLSLKSKDFRIGEKVVIVGGKTQDLCCLKGQSMEVVQHRSGEHPVLMTKKETTAVALQLKPPKGKPVLVPVRLLQPETLYFDEVMQSMTDAMSTCVIEDKRSAGTGDHYPETVAALVVQDRAFFSTEKALFSNKHTQHTIQTNT